MAGASRVLVAGKQKSGKTTFVLSACALGRLAVSDTEFVLQEYVEEHPTARTPAGKPLFTPMAHVKRLLGIAEEEWPEIAILQSNDLGAIRSFLYAVARDPKVVTVGRDSQSVIWDLASSAIGGPGDRGNWNAVKQPLRLIQYDLMASGKHLIMTAHLDSMFNADMTKVVGQRAWTEKKDPYTATWELHLEFGEGMRAPVATVVGEVSGGRIARGTTIRNPSFPRLLDLIGRPRPLLGAVIGAQESTYRAAAEVEMAQAAVVAAASTPTGASSEGSVDNAGDGPSTLPAEPAREGGK
jgi:hypothetical protein